MLINSISDLKILFKKFEIENWIIDEILKNKKIVKRTNIYLLNEKQILEKNQVFENEMILISIKKELIFTNTLYDLILRNTKNFLEVPSEKKAIQFTYSKDLKMENIKKSKENKKLKLKNKSFYILTNNKKVIGVCKFNEFENTQFLNIQNIGSFIKE